MTSKKRLLDQWECPVCTLTLDDSCVPAVMNCRPFAHVICMACANELLQRGQAKCPKCMTPFADARPLSDFVDNDNAEVADTLAKRARLTTPFEQRLAVRLAEIDDHTIRQRVEFLARRTLTNIATMKQRGFQVRICYSSTIPAFDAGKVAIRVTDARRIMGIRRPNRVKLTDELNAITQVVLPYVEDLFAAEAKLEVKLATNHTSYLSLRVELK